MWVQQFVEQPHLAGSGLKLPRTFRMQVDRQGCQVVESVELGLHINVPVEGHSPRSGLLLAHCLDQYSIQGSTLDLGTGDTGFLAYYMLARGADRVTAVDLNPVAIERAERASTQGCRINWAVSDLFSGVAEAGPFDLIVSNPPQMPMPSCGSLHDFGGPDGRATIMRILEQTPRHLSKGGSLFLLCFDFLGAVESYSTAPTLIETAAEYGLTGQVVAEYDKPVHKGGHTERNLSWIQVTYPKYRFQVRPAGELFHKVDVLRLHHVR